MEDFKVSAVQMNALKDDLDHNLDVHVRFTEEAANAGSAMAVLSEDIGICDEGGLELRGRASGADVRGCSLSAAEWHVPT
jgi:hypothetical protein